MKKTKKIRRSADTGEFVSKEEAAANPKETYVDTVPVGTRESPDIVPESGEPWDGNDDVMTEEDQQNLIEK